MGSVSHNGFHFTQSTPLICLTEGSNVSLKHIYAYIYKHFVTVKLRDFSI